MVAAAAAAAVVVAGARNLAEGGMKEGSLPDSTSAGIYTQAFTFSSETPSSFFFFILDTHNTTSSKIQVPFSKHLIEHGMSFGPPLP